MALSNNLRINQDEVSFTIIYMGKKMQKLYYQENMLMICTYFMTTLVVWNQVIWLWLGRMKSNMCTPNFIIYN